MDVRIDPAGQNRQPTKVVVDRTSLRIDRDDLRALNNDARVLQYLPFAVEQSARSNDDASLLAQRRGEGEKK
jgi:hypothetical protein